MTDQPTIIIIVGITGDLSKRYLLPAIDEIAKAKVVPNKFKIVGVTRRSSVELKDLTRQVKDPSFLNQNVEIFQMDLHKEADYGRLDEYLKQIEDGFGGPAQRLFYLSVPPVVSQSIIELLGTSGLAAVAHTKLLLEKPFGVDLASAEELVNHINKHFDPNQVYRIDHYLAKEMTQNLIVFREDNILFKKTWNNNFISSIRITASEQLGIEGRADFYEQTGAMRDFVQSHLLQLAALTLMDNPRDLPKVPDSRLTALQQLEIATPDKITDSVLRAQYHGYRDEVSNPQSTVETFVSLRLKSNDPRWHGVPIILASGKSLRSKNTSIRITYHKEECEEADELLLSFKPHEGVDLYLWSKRPGYDQQIERRPLNFTYTADERLPDAYEKVILDTINSDHSLFATSAEILETWRIIDPVQKAWAASSDDLKFYQPGTGISDLIDHRP